MRTFFKRLHIFDSTFQISRTIQKRQRFFFYIYIECLCVKAYVKVYNWGQRSQSPIIYFSIYGPLNLLFLYIYIIQHSQILLLSLFNVSFDSILFQITHPNAVTIYEAAKLKFQILLQFAPKMYFYQVFILKIQPRSNIQRSI